MSLAFAQQASAPAEEAGESSSLKRFVALARPYSPKAHLVTMEEIPGLLDGGVVVIPPPYTHGEGAPAREQELIHKVSRWRRRYGLWTVIHRVVALWSY